MMKRLLALYLLTGAFQAQSQGTFCDETQLTFSLEGGSYAWYSAPTGGALVGNGSSVTVPKGAAYVKASSPDSIYALYAEGKTIAGFSAAEASKGSYGTPSDGTQGSNQLKLRFSAFQPITIDSLTISISTGSLSCSSNPSPKVTLVIYKPDDSTFTPISKQITFDCKGIGEGLYRIPVGLQVPNAGDYAIRVSIGAIGSFRVDYYSPTQNPYPNYFNGVISFTGDDDGDDNTSLVPSLFDWHISSVSSPGRIEVTKHKDCGLGIEVFSLDKSTIEAYPSPFDESFNLIWKKGEPATAIVLNMDGKEIERHSLATGQYISLGHKLPSGIFLLRVQTTEKTFVSKIVKR